MKCFMFLFTLLCELNARLHVLNLGLYIFFDISIGHDRLEVSMYSLLFQQIMTVLKYLCILCYSTDHDRFEVSMYSLLFNRS